MPYVIPFLPFFLTIWAMPFNDKESIEQKLLPGYSLQSNEKIGIATEKMCIKQAT